MFFWFLLVWTWTFSCWTSCRRCFRTLSTLALVLADVSTYWTPHSPALAVASSAETCRRSSRSDLLPTSSRGMASSSFTLRICSLTHRTHSTLRNDRSDLTGLITRTPDQREIKPGTWTRTWRWRTRAPWWRTPAGNPPRCGSSCLWWRRSPPAPPCPGCRSARPRRPEPPSSCSCPPWWARSPPQTGSRETIIRLGADAAKDHGRCSAEGLPRHTWTGGWGRTFPRHRCPPWSPCGGPETSGSCSYRRPWLWPAGTRRDQQGPEETSRDQKRPAGTSRDQQGPEETRRERDTIKQSDPDS